MQTLEPLRDVDLYREMDGRWSEDFILMVLGIRSFRRGVFALHCKINNLMPSEIDEAERERCERDFVAIHYYSYQLNYDAAVDAVRALEFWLQMRSLADESNPFALYYDLEWEEVRERYCD